MRTDNTDRDEALMPTAWLAIPIAAAAASGFVQLALRPMNGDAAWYVYMAGRVLDGARPYEDIVDTNPPLIVLLNLAVVALARVAEWSPLVVLAAVIIGLTGLSLTLSWRLSRGLPTALRQSGLLTWSYLLLAYVGVESGQREHLHLILILPYAYAAVAELRGDRPPRWLAVSSGLMAGVGFALKPFLVLPVAGVELFLAVRRGLRSWLRPQAVAMGAVFVAYAVALATWTPQYFAVARRFAPLYPYLGPAGPMLLASSWRLLVVAGAVALAWSLARRRAPGWAEVFGLLAAGATAHVYLTGKGWSYHWLPAMSIAWSLLGGSAAMAALHHPPAWRRSRAAAGLILLTPLLSALPVADCLYCWGDIEATRAIREHAGAGDAVLALSPWIYRTFPMINQTGVTWGMRHPMLWQIGAFYADGSWRKGRYHALDAMSGPERRFVGEVAADFANYRPVLLLVDLDPPTPDLPGFDYLEYLAIEPRFARALADYEYLTHTYYFRVYRRRDAVLGPEIASRAATTTAAQPPRRRLPDRRPGEGESFGRAKRDEPSGNGVGTELHRLKPGSWPSTAMPRSACSGGKRSTNGTAALRQDAARVRSPSAAPGFWSSDPHPKSEDII